MHEQPISPPIFVAEGQDLSVFRSVEAAESHVESPDADVYVAFDRAGRKLRFLGKTESRGRWIRTVDIGPVRLVPQEGAEPEPEELRSLLVECLAASGEPEDTVAAKPLKQLVDLAVDRFSIS